MDLDEIDCGSDVKESIIKHFSDLGFIVADGSKFGGDFVIYTAAGPELVHSKYLLFILDKEVTWRELISYYRVASQTAKIPVLAFRRKEVTDMAGDGLKHVVHRRVHLERSQPEHRRRKVGQYLEKKQDYKRRSERYHTRERIIKELSSKTRFKNEDEFNFKMIHGRIGDEGQVVLESQESAKRRKMTNKERLRNEINTINRNLFVLQHKENMVKKKIESLIQANSAMVKENKPLHIIYSDDEAPDGPASGDSTPAPERSADPDDPGVPKRTTRGTKKSRADAASEKAARANGIMEMSDMFDKNREIETLRRKLQDRRELTVARYKKRQVLRVPNGDVKVYKFSSQRQK